MMTRKSYLKRIANQLNVAFIILLIVTIYEVFYLISNPYSGLSLVLAILSGAVTYFAYILKNFFEDMAENVKDNSDD